MNARDGAAELDRVEKELLGRWPESRIEWKLDRMRALTHALGDPHLAYPVVHIAGTNGKSSTARMVEVLLRAMNLRTGLFTSPHLESMTERIAVDGEPLSAARFCEVHDDVAPYFALVDEQFDVRLSFFEAVTGMAFAAFAEAPVDAAVIEVGMGGRLDATNIVQPAVTVVTSVSLDHMEYLGDTVAAIAGEKAGILKAGVPVALAKQVPEADEVLRAVAAKVGAPVVAEGVDFAVEDRQIAVGGQVLTLRTPRAVYADVFLPLHGEHQARNAACALAAAEEFAAVATALDARLVRRAFATARSPGRLETVRSDPTVLIDAAHNPAGARATAAAVTEEFRFGHLVGVVAVLADKDARGVLVALEPALAEVVVTRNGSHRAMDVDALGALAVEVFGAARVVVEPGFPAALERAVETAEEWEAETAPAASAGAPASDRERPGAAGVLVTGSVVTAGEARGLLLRAATTAAGTGAGSGTDTDSAP